MQRLPDFPSAPSVPPVPPPFPPKPVELSVIAAMTLASGVTNLIWSLTLAALTVLSGMGEQVEFAFALGVACLPFILPLFILSVVEIVYSISLFNLPSSGARISIAVAIFEIVAALYLNVISLASGITALILQGNRKVGNYFAYLEAVETRKSWPSA